jgi:uncharacterized membrane protein YccC
MDAQARHALKTALAAVLAWMAYESVGVMDRQHATWGAMAAVLVMQSNLGGLLKAAGNRGLGTAIGSVTGGLAVLAFGPSPLTLALAIAVTMYCCGLLKLTESYRLAGATVVLVVLSAHSRSDGFQAGVARMADVGVGIGVALLVQGFVWPARAGEELRDGLASALRLGAAYLRTLPSNDRERTRPARLAFREEVRKSRDLLDDLRREPGAYRPDEPLIVAFIDQLEEVQHHLRAVEHAQRIARESTIWTVEIVPAGAAFEWLAQAITGQTPSDPPPDLGHLLEVAEGVLTEPCDPAAPSDTTRTALYYNLRSLARHLSKMIDLLAPTADLSSASAR